MTMADTIENIRHKLSHVQQNLKSTFCASFIKKKNLHLVFFTTNE